MTQEVSSIKTEPLTKEEIIERTRNLEIGLEGLCNYLEKRRADKELRGMALKSYAHEENFQIAPRSGSGIRFYDSSIDGRGSIRLSADNIVAMDNNFPRGEKVVVTRTKYKKQDGQMFTRVTFISTPFSPTKYLEVDENRMESLSVDSDGKVEYVNKQQGYLGEPTENMGPGTNFLLALGTITEDMKSVDFSEE